MKKTLFAFGFLLVVILVVWVSCTPNEEEKSKTVSSDTTYLLLSHLAFQAYLLDSLATLEHTQALYLVAQADTRALAKHLGLSDSGDISLLMDAKTAKPTVAAFFPTNNSLAVMALRGKIDLCPCPSSTDLCPCPGINSSVLFANRSTGVRVTAAPDSLAANSIVGTTADAWKAFPLTNIADRNFTLIINVDFTSSGVNTTYRLPMVLEGGRLYVGEWPE